MASATDYVRVVYQSASANIDLDGKIRTYSDIAKAATIELLGRSAAAEAPASALSLRGPVVAASKALALEQLTLLADIELSDEIDRDRVTNKSWFRLEIGCSIAGPRANFADSEATSLSAALNSGTEARGPPYGTHAPADFSGLSHWPEGMIAVGNWDGNRDAFAIDLVFLWLLLCADDPISRASAALRANMVDVLPGGHLRLRGCAWPGATSCELFVRSFYAPLFDHRLNMCRAEGRLDHQLRASRHLITGQPGTGKSVLLWYIAKRLLHEQPSRSVVLIDGPKKSVVILQPDGRLFAFPFDKLHELRFIHGLVDPVILSDSHLPVLMPFPTIVASSPGSIARGDKAIRKEFMPPIHLPVPSRREVQELRALAFGDVPADVVDRRMDVWGPIPRFVLVRVAPSDQRAQWACVQQVPLDDVVRVMRGAAALSSAGAGDDGDATHRVVLEHAACEGAAQGSPASDPCRWEYYERGPVAVASAAILRWLLNRMIAEQNWNVAFLVDSTARIAKLGALRGLAFEPLSLAVLRRGGTFRVRRLRGAEVSLEDVDGAGAAAPADEDGEEDSASAGKKRRHASAFTAGKPVAASFAGTANAVVADVTTGESLLEVPAQTAHAWRLSSDLAGLGTTPEMLVPVSSNSAGLGALLWLQGPSHHVPIDCTVSDSHGLHQRDAAQAIEALGWSSTDGWPLPEEPAVGTADAGAAAVSASLSRRAPLQAQYYWVLPEDVWSLWSCPQPAKRGTGHVGLSANLVQFALCIPQLLRFQALQGALSELSQLPEQILEELAAAGPAEAAGA